MKILKFLLGLLLLTTITYFGFYPIALDPWDIPTHQFTILYDANKVSLEEVHQAIARDFILGMLIDSATFFARLASV